jgi:hypothetical protein
MANPWREYDVDVRVTRIWTTTVKARSHAEACDAAMARYQDAPIEEEEFEDAMADCTVDHASGATVIHI